MRKSAWNVSEHEKPGEADPHRIESSSLVELETLVLQNGMLETEAYRRHQLHEKHDDDDMMEKRQNRR